MSDEKKVTVEILTSMVGKNFAWNIGDIVEVSASDAESMCAKGYARLPAKKKTIETTAKEQGEKRKAKKAATGGLFTPPAPPPAKPPEPLIQPETRED
jgi:hypothetical protein